MKRFILLALGAFLAFGATLAITLRLMPGVHRPIDFMAAGAAATLVAMLLVFFVLISTAENRPTAFFKRRRAGSGADRKDSRTFKL